MFAHLVTDPEGIDLVREMAGRYREDDFFRDVLNDPKQFKNFEVTTEGLIFLKDRGNRLLCIPHVLIYDRNAREIVITHAHSLLAHLGASKTLSLLRDHVWWKTMSADVHKYCETCLTCKRSKPTNQKPYGLLNPLSVPGTPWEAIGIDFVGPLPESKNRDGTYNSITVIICLLTAMVHLVPSRIDYKAKQVAELVFSEVYKLHGMPRYVVSDRDVLFTSQFWTHLHALTGVQLRMSSAYHPQSDGSTERANRTVTQMLRQCINPSQKDWVSKLPAIEFAINLARSDSTGYSPFCLNSGRMPRPMIWNAPPKDEYPSVRVYAQKIKNAIMAAHDSILVARVKQTRDANRRRRPAPFVESDLVYISTKNINLPVGSARKLAPKYIGPYRILQDFGNNSYRIELPSNLKKRGVHDVFHASLLRVHEPNDDRLFPGRLDSQVLDLDEHDNEWAIDKIIGHSGTGAAAIFKVRWKTGDETWVSYQDLAELEPMKAYLEAMGADHISALRVGTSNPPKDDPQVFSGSLEIGCRAPIKCLDVLAELYREFSTHSYSNPTPTLFHSSSFVSLPIPTHALTMSANLTMNSAIRRLNDNSIVLSDPLTLHSFVIPPDLLRLYGEHDRRLRNGSFNPNATTVPIGYDLFSRLWDQDENCPYAFSTYSSGNGSVTIRGLAIPLDVLAGAAPNTLDDVQEATVNDLLWANAERTGFERRKRAERLKEKRMRGAVLMNRKDIEDRKVVQRNPKPKERKRKGKEVHKGSMSCELENIITTGTRKHHHYGNQYQLTHHDHSQWCILHHYQHL